MLTPSQPACPDAFTEDSVWVLYLIECVNGYYYAGITNHLTARWQAHCAGKGARFTRANPPKRLLAACPYPDRSAASRAEWEIKQLARRDKLAYITARLAAPAP